MSYDKDGNIKLMDYLNDGALSDFTYSYSSSSNRLQDVEDDFGAETPFGYDPNGNVTTIGGSYNISSTTYNWQNLPTAITKSDITYNYRYDHEGMRVYKQEGDNIHTLRGAFGEVIASYKNGSLDYRNIVLPAGTVIGRREGSNRLYYHRDHLGSTRTVVNASGTVVETQDYYPFGLQMPGRSLTTGNSAREKFTSHELDSEVDLYYMVARRYAPEFGRFLSVDPLTGMYPELSPYVYTLNNPVLWIDPTGLCPEDGSAGKNQFGPGYCMEAVVVTADRPTFHNDFQGHDRFFHIGGEWAIWWYGIRNLGKPHNVSIFQERSSGDYYGAYTDWRYNTGIAPVPGGRKMGDINEIRSIINVWHKATFRNTSQSIKYHHRKHVIQQGMSKSLKEYTDDAISFFNNNKHLGTSITLRDGTPGIRIRTVNGPGGIFTNDGQVVSFWYK